MTYDPFLDPPRPVPNPRPHGLGACALILAGGLAGGGLVAFAVLTVADRFLRRVFGS